jgi:gamma-glutamyl-gamma-aminobutyrate hydrolase PuuD
MTRDARPFIGVTADLSEAPGKLDNYQESTLFVPQRYLSAIEQAGAIALVLPPNQSEAAQRRRRLSNARISSRVPMNR